MKSFEWLLRTGYYSVSLENVGDGAQLVDGQWYMPKFGCDTLQHIKDEAQVVEVRSRCFFCSTPTQATDKGQACPKCGGRPT